MPKLTATLLLLCTALFAQQKGTFTDTRDGKIYKTTKIGEQVWMAENLNYEAKGSRCYGEGGKVYGGTTLSNAEIQAYCNKYGKLYNWETAMKACPSGWHLPNKAEWEVLAATIGGDTIAGKYLKATNGWNENGNGEDKFGFSALPGGYGWEDGIFDDVGNAGDWWSSFSKKNIAYRWYIGYESSIRSYYEGKDDLYSVRCLQDTPAPPKGEAK